MLIVYLVIEDESDGDSLCRDNLIECSLHFSTENYQLPVLRCC
jgi:hypothetical protein